ncbi:hypothetical protein I656_02422 [Geobacillus sp. WSUCF1]|nr:hypothetical protein I656_02422 [Geobacillus sp. WSUCF1]
MKLFSMSVYNEMTAKVIGGDGSLESCHFSVPPPFGRGGTDKTDARADGRLFMW